MTIKKVVKFFLQGLVFTLAAYLADLPSWQFFGVVFLVILGDRIGKSE